MTRTWLINGAVLTGSIVVALLLAEIILRVIGFSVPVFYTYDDVTGSKLFPGAEGWQRSRSLITGWHCSQVRTGRQRWTPKRLR